jgi:SAM-dependent methyltransferase
MTITPDTKDWTWVLDRPCPECGFDAVDAPLDRLPEGIRDNAAAFVAALAGPDVALRPDPATWSVLEYAAHVRDVHRVFDERVALMLAEDEPCFENWDQNAAAVEGRYGEQEPALVAAELVAAAERVAERYAGVPGRAWERAGRRSNGSRFTVASLGRYHLHDVVHHRHDVAAAARRATVAAYDASAEAYRDAGFAFPDAVRALVARFAGLLPADARVLEVGSGPGRDAIALEAVGLHVRRTDVSAAFVDLLRADGFRADVLDPLTDDLVDPQRAGRPYDGVWASASLLHAARAELPVVLRRLAEATVHGGVLHVALKEGDGEGWSTHGHVAAPRHFTYWREQPLRDALEAAGWSVLEVVRRDGERGERWLGVMATRRLA